MKNTNYPSLAGEAVYLTISKGFALIISMACTMLLSRFRTVEEYGTYSQLLLVINLYTAIFMLGLPSSINYFLARAESQEDRRKFLSVYYTLSTLLGAVIGGALCLSVPLIEAYFGNRAIRGFVYFLAVYPWANVISSSVENVLIVYRRTRFLMGYRILNSMCLLGVVLATQWMNWDFSAYMRLFLLVFCGFAISVYVIVIKLEAGLHFLLDCAWVRTIFSFSVPIGLASVVSTLSIEIDKLLIGRMMDTETMAIYTNAARELPVTIIASSITAVLLPRMTRMLKDDDAHGAVRLWGHATELSFSIICLIVAGVFVYAEDVLALLYSEKYLPGISVFRVYTLLLLVRCTYFGMVLNAKGKSRAVLYSSVASLLLNALLNPLFYAIFGMVGPAIATFLATIVVLVAQLIFSAKCLDIHFCTIFPWARLGQILVINCLFALVFAWIKDVLILDVWVGSFAESLLLGGGWSLIYVVLMRKRLTPVWKELTRQ